MKSVSRPTLSAARLLSSLGILAIANPAQANGPSISNNFNGGTIVVRASADKFAGAIESITFRGVQYVDVADHGREMQMAIQADGLGECFNPNEAGTRNDANFPFSSSVLNYASNAGNVLSTQTRPAFWLQPGEYYKAACNPNLPGSPWYAQNTTLLSDYTFSRTTSFFGATAPNLLVTNATIAIPDTHGNTNTEALTGYLPSSFNTFLKYDLTSKTLVKLIGVSAADNNHYNQPVIVAQANGQHAMGVTSNGINAGSGYYALFNFGGSTPTSKWSCVYGHGPVQPGDLLSYQCAFAVGNVDEVVAAMNAFPSQNTNPMIPVYRFYKYPRHFFTLSYAEGAGSGHSFETTGFHLYPAGYGAGYYPLYRCYNSGNGDHFISTQSNCEGKNQEGIYGYASPTQQSGQYPLYRFYRANTADHLETINYAEGVNNGFTYEGILGYVTP